MSETRRLVVVVVLMNRPGTDGFLGLVVGAGLDLFWRARSVRNLCLVLVLLLLFLAQEAEDAFPRRPGVSVGVGVGDGGGGRGEGGGG